MAFHGAFLIITIESVAEQPSLIPLRSCKRLWHGAADYLTIDLDYEVQILKVSQTQVENKELISKHVAIVGLPLGFDNNSKCISPILKRNAIN